MGNEKKWFCLVAMALGVAGFQSVDARPPKVKAYQVEADTKAKFDIVATEVRAQMVAGGRFENVSDKERAQVNESLNEMAGMFDKTDAVANMDTGTKVRLFNDQEVVNAILLRKDDKRVICENHAALGSNIPKTECRTFGEIERGRRDSYNTMSHYSTTSQPNGGNLSKRPGGAGAQGH